jgi:hypothetical protein
VETVAKIQQELRECLKSSKEFLAEKWIFNLEELRNYLRQILSSLTNKIVGF